MTTIHDLPTPALVFDADALAHNLRAMAAVRPGASLRPHVKAHKCTALAAAQVALGHRSFTCATAREVLGLVEAGVGDDLLLANEIVDPGRLGALAAAQGAASITVAIDSEETLDAAARAGIRQVLVDVDVGLPRCGCAPDAAGTLAERARARGIEVRGVMGYEGHLMMVLDPAEQRRRVEAAMDLLFAAHTDVGGEVVSSGGTGTHHLHDRVTALGRVTEVQAGSYTLMDTQYAQHGFAFRQAAFVLGTVVSTRLATRGTDGHAVADVGLKALGMDHGNPSVVGGRVWFCSDEHVTFGREPDSNATWRVGDRVHVVPAHIDPTVSQHASAWIVRGDEVVDRWPIDLPRLVSEITGTEVAPDDRDADRRDADGQDADRREAVRDVDGTADGTGGGGAETDRAAASASGSLGRGTTWIPRLTWWAIWAWTAVMGALTFTQLVGVTELSLVYVLQALTPAVLAPSIPLAAIAVWRRRWVLAAIQTVVAVVLIVLVWPVIAHGSPPSVPVGAPSVRIAFANTYFDNEQPEAAAATLLSLDADLVGMAEFTPRQEEALAAAGAFAAYPYRAGNVEWGRDGIVLYSRFPFASVEVRRLGTVDAVDAVVVVDGQPVRVLVVHPNAGVDPRDVDRWERDLDAVHDVMRTVDGPMAVIGDFNASRWHPPFRDLLRGTGFHDVHEWLGAGFSRSWPIDEPVPAFVRIDHALVDGLVPMAVTDIDTPGSDHRGYVTTLAVVPGT